MEAIERWWDWIEELRVQLGSPQEPATYQAIADRVGLHVNTVLGWTKHAVVPTVKVETKLKAIAGERLAASLSDILDAAREVVLRRKLAADRARFARLARAALSGDIPNRPFSPRLPLHQGAAPLVRTARPALALGLR